MAKIKILQIIGSSSIGGAEKVFYYLLKFFNKEKYEIYVACPAGGMMFEDFRKYAIEVKTFNFKNWLNPATILSLSRYMRQKNIDIVHTHLYSADFMGLIAARISGVSCKLSTIHGYNFNGTGQFDLRSIKNFLCSFVYRAVYIFCDKVIAVCQAVKLDLIKRPGIKVKEDKIELIYNGIEPEGQDEHSGLITQRFKDIFRNNDNFKFVGLIANFDRVKGHRILIKAIPSILEKELNVKFILSGDGEDKERIRQMVRKLKIEKNVIFTGLLEEISEIISICDVIVLSSFFEGLPLIIMEAMSWKKPVVATRIGGLGELVEEGKSGILVAPNDYKELSGAITRILKDKTLALKMGQRGGEIASSKFQAQEMIKNTERLYERVLSSKGL